MCGNGCGNRGNIFRRKRSAANFSAIGMKTNLMLAEHNLHRNSCRFEQYLNDILNEILSGKESRGSFIPASPASVRIPEFYLGVRKNAYSRSAGQATAVSLFIGRSKNGGAY
jgi:hypothetical protein